MVSLTLEVRPSEWGFVHSLRICCALGKEQSRLLGRGPVTFHSGRRPWIDSGSVCEGLCRVQVSEPQKGEGIIEAVKMASLEPDAEFTVPDFKSLFRASLNVWGYWEKIAKTKFFRY